MTNLYDAIVDLTSQKKALHKQIANIEKELKTDPSYHGNSMQYGTVIKKSKRMIERDALLGLYEDIENKLTYFEEEYAISISDMEKIISQYTGNEHKFKIIREIGYDKVVYHTSRYVACFMNLRSPYYEKPAEFALSKSQYDEMLNTLYKTKTLVLSNSANLGFVSSKLMGNLQSVNFIKSFTRGKMSCDAVVNPKFMKKIKPAIVKQLKETNVVVGENVFDVTR